MQFFCGDSAKLEESFSSRARTSNSKRGIQVTLSKQKSTHGKHQHSTQKQNQLNSSFNSVGSQNRAYQTQGNQSGHERLNSNQTQIIRFSENQSVQSDLISSYFEKSHQKQCVRKESAVLDEQIRKLQMQIYNTRTKITEAKYLAKKQSQSKLFQTIKNSRKSKQKIKHDETQAKSSKSLKNQNLLNLALKATQKHASDNAHSSKYQNHTQLNSRSPISVIYNKSPAKLMRSEGRSRSPSPPHPSILRQMLSSTKKSNTKNHHIHQSQTDFYRKQISLTEQPIQKFHYNSSDFADSAPRKNSKQHNQQEQNLELNSIQAQSRNIKKSHNQNNQQSKKPKPQKNPKKVSTKKRSMSAYSNNLTSSNLQNIKKNQQKSLYKSSEQFSVKRKSKISDFNIDLDLPLNNRRKFKNINSLISDTQNITENKNKKTKKEVFSNELLMKAYKLEGKSKAKINKIEDQIKPRQKRKKSSKKSEDEIQRLSSNLTSHNNKIHQWINNSSHHSTIKSKYIKSKVVLS